LIAAHPAASFVMGSDERGSVKHSEAYLTAATPSTSGRKRVMQEVKKVRSHTSVALYHVPTWCQKHKTH